MALSDNYSIPSPERLAMLINETNGLNVQHGVDFTTDAPKPYNFGLQYNTSVVLRWMGSMGSHAERIFYRRLSLDTINQGKPAPVLRICEPGFYVNDILDLINGHFGTSFQVGELVNDFIENEQPFYECHATDTSLAWQGGKLVFSIDFQKKRLDEVASVNRLDGLYPPKAMPDVSAPDLSGIADIWL